MPYFEVNEEGYTCEVSYSYFSVVAAAWRNFDSCCLYNTNIQIWFNL